MRKNPHVRICGGLGSATTLVYPTARQRDAARPGEDESEDHRGQGEQHRDETGRETRVEAEPDHRQNDHADRQPQRELQRSSHADRAYYGVPRATPPGASASRGGRENRADRCRRVRTGLCAMLFCSTYARHRIRHGIRHTAARAGRRSRPPVLNGRLRHRRIGDARVSKGRTAPSRWTCNATRCRSRASPPSRQL